MVPRTIKLCGILFFIATVYIQCRTTQTTRPEKKDYKSIYIDQFKLTYFRKVLQAGFNHSESINIIVNSDRSGFKEPILSEDDYRLIDSLVRLDNLQMTNDSLRRIGRVGEGSEGKHVLGFILERLESKWLDSLAKQRFKIARF